MSISEISESAWQGVMQLQYEAYVELQPESLAVLKSKWRVSPNTCLVYKALDNTILGYLLSHSWERDSPPALYAEIADMPVTDNLFIHDLAIANSSQGMGVGKHLVYRLIEIAIKRGFNTLQLVAVQGTISYWSKFGFKQVQACQIDSSYAEAARLMTLDLLVNKPVSSS